MSINNGEFVHAVSMRYNVAAQDLHLAAERGRPALVVRSKQYGSHEHTAELQGGVRVCRLLMAPATATTVHLHREKSHFFLVEEGRLTFWAEDVGRVTYDAGSFCFVAPGVPHELRNDGETPLRLLEVMNPATFDDKVILLEPETEARLLSKVIREFGLLESEIGPYRTALRTSSAALAAQAQRTLVKPYGENRIVLTHEGYGVSFVRMKPGQSTSLHQHGKRRELFLVRDGELTLESGGAVSRLRPGEWDESTPGVPHRLSNQGAGLLEIVELFTPCLLDDKERLSDSYGRRLGGVTHAE